MYGAPPWATSGLPPMPMSPQMTGSQPTDPYQAQQAAMYQYMQAAPWQFGPGGFPGWAPMSAGPPPPWMYSMHPNAYPGSPTSPPAPAGPTPLWMYSMYPNAYHGSPTSPPAPPATASPPSESSKGSLIPSASSGPGSSAAP